MFFEVLFQSHETFDLEVRKAALLLLNTLMSHNKVCFWFDYMHVSIYVLILSGCHRVISDAHIPSVHFTEGFPCF